MEVRVGDGENAVVALGFSLQPLIAGLQQKGGPDKDGEFASAQQISARTYRGDKEGSPLPILLTMVRQAPPSISPIAPSAPGQLRTVPLSRAPVIEKKKYFIQVWLPRDKRTGNPQQKKLSKPALVHVAVAPV